MTNRTEIAGWFDKGVMIGATHLIVVCDTYDHEDYPVFMSSPADCLAKYKHPGEMQRVMEVYDLAQDKAEQMAEFRAMRLPKEIA